MPASLFLVADTFSSIGITLTLLGS